MPANEPQLTLGERLRHAPAGNRFIDKDLAKAGRSTQMIGQGTPGSSTERYRIAAGELANTGRYTAADIVFVSANGQRPGRFNPIDAAGRPLGVYRNLERAVLAGATIVTDIPADRNRPYNTGERQVAAWLQRSGYAEVDDGVWRPAQPDVSKPSATSVSDETVAPGDGIVVVNKHRLSAAEQRQVIYIGRGSPLGNPYMVKPHGPYERGTTLQLYERHLRERIAVGDAAVCDALNEIWRRARRGERVRLMCFCAPERGHGEIIADVVREKLP